MATSPDKTAVWPAGMEPDANPLKISPGVLSGDHLFVTGMTGSLADGTMPSDPDVQFRAAFGKITQVLDAAGLGFAHVVDMTTYHIDIDRHFDSFAAIRAEHVETPYPAWTAVGVAALRRPGALVEIKVVARKPAA